MKFGLAIDLFYMIDCAISIREFGLKKKNIDFFLNTGQ